MYVVVVTETRDYTLLCFGRLFGMGGVEKGILSIQQLVVLMQLEHSEREICEEQVSTASLGRCLGHPGCHYPIICIANSITSFGI